MEKIISLSERLNALAVMTGSCDTFTDIGTDHGLLPLYLIQKGACKRAVASDINKGPLKKAMENAKAFGIGEDKISFVLSDGLKALDDPPEGHNVLSISGMGGLLIEEILREGKEKIKCYDSFILSPHTKQYELRRFLTENGFIISDERYLTEENKLYVIIKAARGQINDGSSYSEEDYRFGRFIDKALRDEKVKECLAARYRELKSLTDDNVNLPPDRRTVLQNEKDSYRKVLGI